ncbi:unnamed protein product [Sympodiomycopsis kandeliae]
MATDPFHTFQSTVESSLHSAQQLSQTYHTSLQRGKSQDELQLNQDRLEDSIEALKQDVEDVKQSINVVQSNPARFGIDEVELERRRGFLQSVQDEILSLESGIEKGRGFTSIDMRQHEGEEDDQAEFEREHQQSLMSNQDDILSSIGRTLSSLKNQASNMGNELSEQNELITTFDGEVQQSENRLSSAKRKMDKLTENIDGWTGGWSVWILILLLFFLLLIAILI